MLPEFQDHIEKNFPFLKSAKLLLALSGGVDSIVLAHLLKKAGLNTEWAHCNFQLRGRDSEEDQIFLQNLSVDWQVKLHTKRFAILETVNAGQSIQLEARKQRYDWFEELRKEHSFAYILTAHHLNDDAETFFINLLRGTGLEGLTGIPAINGPVVRPLLSTSRKEIESYAEAQNLKWREDVTNTSLDYLRNRIRHRLMPLLEAENENFLAAYRLTRDHLNSASELIEQYVEELKKELLHEEKNRSYLSIPKLKALKAPESVLYYLFKEYGFTAWKDLYDLIDAQPGKMIYSSEYRLLKDRNHLILEKIQPREREIISIDRGEKVISFPNGHLICEKVINVTNYDKSKAYLAADKLKFPLQLRRWESGDTFRPLGMKGHKKLSDFLKDEKLDRYEKEDTWVLESDKEIVWVVNHRINEDYKLKPDTREILKVEYIEK